MSAVKHILTNMLANIGRSALFLFTVLASLPGALLRPRLVVQQLYTVGMQSMVIIVISGAFIGMVLGFQGYHVLSNFGAAESLGAFVALTIVRELGPVVTALLFAGRAGSALAAEIGLMRATDQLSGMEMMAVDPVQRVIAPRFVAGLISLPLLTAIFNVMSLGVSGGYFIGVQLLGVDAGAYWSQIHANVDYGDLRECFIKSVVFATAVSWIAVYQGYHSAPTSAGVSQATTTTVVISSLMVLGLDLILTALMFH